VCSSRKSAEGQGVTRLFSRVSAVRTWKMATFRGILFGRPGKFLLAKAFGVRQNAEVLYLRMQDGCDEAGADCFLNGGEK
jgi:hypothetical protein